MSLTKDTIIEVHAFYDDYKTDLLDLKRVPWQPEYKYKKVGTHFS